MTNNPAQRVRAVFRKAVSDGNYGSEVAEASIEVDVEEGEEGDAFVEVLLKEVRQRVHAELLRSPSAAVRRALEPPRPQPVVANGPPEEDDDEDLPY
jgi:hypothetical protein